MSTPIESVEQTTSSLSSASHNLSEQEQSPPPSRYATLYQMWSEVILPFLVSRLLLLLVGVVTIYYILPLINRHQPIVPITGNRFSRFPDMLFLMWEHFDSGFYLDIAHHGYWGANTLHGMSNWVFFPLYPLLIHLVALPFGSSDDTFRLAGLFVSNCAALAAAIYLYKLTTKELGRTSAARAILYLLFFPMSFYLSAIYPESLFLALGISCIYYARLHRWWLAGLLGGLAALTRPQGVLLALVVGWEYLQYMVGPFDSAQQTTTTLAFIQDWTRSRFLNFWRSLTAWRTWLGFVYLLLIPSGLVLFSVYAKWKVGTFTAFSKAEKYGWGREITNPIPVLQHYIQHPDNTTPYNWNFYALNMTIIVVFFLLLIPIFRRLPIVYGIFTLAFLLMPLSSGETDSIARYYLTAFPIFMILAWWSSRRSQEKQTQRHSLIVASFAVLLSVGMVMFTLGVYSIA